MKNPIDNTDLKTLAQCMNTLKEKGFTKDFQVNEEGLKAMDEERVYQPEEVKIVSFYRFEGNSDPGDMSILYAIETSTGVKGTLSDAYGAYAARKVSDFFDKVERIQKKGAIKPWWKFWN